MRTGDGMLGFVLVGGIGVADLHAADPLVHGTSSAAVLQPGAVDADEPVDQPAHAFGERGIGGAGAREQRVAAARRRLHGVQQRGERRLLEIGGVAVPVAAEIGLLVLCLHHLEDVRVAVHSGDEGIEARLAEARADAHQVGGLERLVAEHEDRVLEERAADLAPGVLVRPGERYAADLGSQRTGERLDYHRASL